MCVSITYIRTEMKEFEAVLETDRSLLLLRTPQPPLLSVSRPLSLPVGHSSPCSAGKVPKTGNNLIALEN